MEENEIKIGDQTWTTKNLDVSAYKNGDAIPQVQDEEEWANLTTGAWCYYENDTENGTTYGKLYNWYAVNDPRGATYWMAIGTEVQVAAPSVIGKVI